MKMAGGVNELNQLRCRMNARVRRTVPIASHFVQVVVMGTALLSASAAVLADADEAAPSRMGCGYQSPEQRREVVRRAVMAGEIPDPRTYLWTGPMQARIAEVSTRAVGPTVTSNDLFFYEDSEPVLVGAFTEAQLFDLMTQATNALIAAHGDNYDYVGFYLNYAPSSQIGSAFYAGVFNDATGLGQGVFDDRAASGLNTTKMQGWVMSWNENAWAASDTTMLVYGQEFEHRWAMFLDPLLDGRALQGDDASCGRSAHWNWKVDGQGSGMEIREWVGNGPASLGGTCGTGGFNFICFNTDVGPSPGGLGAVWSFVDLYLMGYVSPAEMDAGMAQLRYMNTGCSSPYNGVISTFNSASIIAANGARTPDFTASQKNFRVGWIVLHLPNNPPNPAQVNNMVAIANRWSATWDWSSLGRGTLDNTIVRLFDIALPASPPTSLTPFQPTIFSIQTTGLVASPDTNTGLLYYSVNGGPFSITPLSSLGAGSFQATIPGVPCGSRLNYYVSIDAVGGGTVTAPNGAPAVTLEAVATRTPVVSDSFETDLGWTVSGALADGAWQRGIPIGGGLRGDPLTDFDGSGRCWLTANRAGNSDVDGGATILTSPMFNLAGLTDPYIAYARWYSDAEGSGSRSDTFVVEVSSNGGASWVNLETVGPNENSTNPQVAGGWYLRAFRIANAVPITNQFRIRFTAQDQGAASLVEAAVDAVKIWDCFVPCGGHTGDINGDVAVDGRDVQPFVTALITGNPDPAVVCPGDFNGSLLIDAGDVAGMVGALLGP